MGFELNSCYCIFLSANMGRFLLSRLTDVNPMLWIALLLYVDPWHQPQGYRFWLRSQTPVYFRELVILMWKLCPLK